MGWVSLGTHPTPHHTPPLCFLLLLLLLLFYWGGVGGLLTMEKRCFWLFCLLSEPFSFYWDAYSASIWGFVPSLLASCYAILVERKYPWRVAELLVVEGGGREMENQCLWGRETSRKGSWEERREGRLDQDVLYERTLNNK